MKKKIRVAMVLAAGYGERLRPLTLERPKPLLPVGGTPIIHTILRQLKQHGFEKVVINTHHLGHMIRESVGDGSGFGLKVYYSEEEKILGAGGGIKAAQKLLGDDTVLVINGDIIADAPLGDIWEHHLKKGGAATLVVKDDPSIPGWGDIKIDDEGRVRQILGRPKHDAPLKPRLFIGIQVIEPVFFSFLKKGVKASSTNDVYPRMLESGLTINSYEYTGKFIDIGTPERYRQACDSL